ncbi:diguanylate cyclase [Rhizobium sp. PP-F2F-G48]|nr:diguanylate cyclase [Rhizobium sp. PP-F2F-G48]
MKEQMSYSGMASKLERHFPEQPHGTAQRIAQAMAQRGVEPLPRNYELFHAAFSGSPATLSSDLAALGNAPSQKALDAIGLKRKLPGYLAQELGAAQQMAIAAIHTMTSAISRESRPMTDALASLDAFLQRLDTDPVMSMSDFAAEARTLQQTLAHLRTCEKRLADAVKTTAATLGDAQTQIAADQRAALRDGLSGLPNGAALSMTIAALFDEQDVTTKPAALVLVSVEHLRALAERHGPEVGAKAVKKCAAIFRKSVKKSDVVARIGYDTFGFLLHDVSEQNAQAIATRIRDAIQSLQIRLPSREFAGQTLSLSAGIATTATVGGPRDLMRHAEMALTMVRTDGRQGILRCTPMMCAQIAGLQEA